MKKFFTCSSRLIKFRSAKIKIILSPHLVFILGLLMSVSVYAQNQGKIQGTVLDEKGGTLPGVSVALKGTTNGVVSDADGKFSISANPGQILVFSYIGYNS